MDKIEALEKMRSELEAGMKLPKCQQCGCMQGALDAFRKQLPAIEGKETQKLAEQAATWSGEMKKVRYGCLGCEYCYPAVAENAFAQAFPDNALPSALVCDFQPAKTEWPVVVGEYFVVDSSAPVAVSTLASVHLAEDLAKRRPDGLAIVGKTETENIGIDKIVKNIVANPGIQYLVVAGQETEGHQSGKTLLALKENGIDATGRIIGSPGKRPILRNVSAAEVEAFRGQVQLIDLIGCEDPAEIRARIEALSPKEPEPCG